MNAPKRNIYEGCKHIKRIKPVPEVNEELSKQLALDFRTFPTFEKVFYEHLYTNHYSLQRNELLKCRWQKYREHIAEKVFEPFQFPSDSDLHFYNGSVKFMPSVSHNHGQSHRMTLRPGPGVDRLGQMPIPNELLLKRV